MVKMDHLMAEKIIKIAKGGSNDKKIFLKTL